MSFNIFPIKMQKIFQCFLPYMSMAAICSIVQYHLNKLTIPFDRKAPCEIWWKLDKQFQKKTFKDYMILYMNIAQGKRQITQRG